MILKKQIRSTVRLYHDKDLLSHDDMFAITGVTKKGGVSHGHEFCVNKTHMYPLFKLHKLSEDKIERKVIPPTRMVTSGVGGPTFRLGTFLDALLKPVMMKYCNEELVKDSTDFIRELQKFEESGQSKNFKRIGTLDVNALYPSIRL